MFTSGIYILKTFRTLVRFMDLNNCRVGFGMAVSDTALAKAFYEGKLGLSHSTGSDENWEYVCGADTCFQLYVSPASAGTSKATQVSWGV